MKVRITLVGLCAVLAGIAGCPMDGTTPDNDNGNTNQNTNENGNTNQNTNGNGNTNQNTNDNGNTNQNTNDNAPDTVAVTGTGTWPLVDGDLQNIRNGMVYLNIHTENNLAGEIRGQVTAGDDANTFVVTLSGNNEVPPVTTDATGTATLTLSEDESTITFEVDAEGLSTPVTGAHFHLGAEGINGDVVFGITDTIEER